MSLLKHKTDKLLKPSSDSENENSEHELSYYLNDRVKMMKEILKIIKPKKIKSMAPDCLKNLDNEEINSMLLEELLGISNKRLKYIFNGQNVNEESSSTDPEDQSADVISLCDISDGDLIIDLDSEPETKKKMKKHHHRPKIKEEPKRKKVKKEKHECDKAVDKNKRDDKNKKNNDHDEEENPMSKKNLMSVLELLELQARARAIRSQLVLETTKSPEPELRKALSIEDNDDEDAVILESPKNEEIVITSSDSEPEEVKSSSERETNAVTKNKVKVIHQTTIREGQGTSDSFWRSSGNGTRRVVSTSTGNIKIIRHTSMKEAKQSSVHSRGDSTTNTIISNVESDSADPKESDKDTEHLITDIPLPNSKLGNELESHTSEICNEKRKVKYPIEPKFTLKENQKSIEEIKQHFTIENEVNPKNYEKCQVILDNTSKSDEISAFNTDTPDQITSKTDKNITTVKDKDVRQTKSKIGKSESRTSSESTSKKSESKSILEMGAELTVEEKESRNRVHGRRIKKLMTHGRSSSVDDAESLVLNADESEMECINLD